MNTKQYIKAEAQLHVASQMLSLTGINFVTKQADDSHTTAKWDQKTQYIVGRSFNLNGNNYQIFVAPLSFEMGIVKNGEETDRFSLDGLSYMQTVEPWKKWFTDAGYEGEINLKLHYELPDSELYRFEAFSKPSDDILNRWAELRTLANHGMMELNKLIGVNSDINIWPHHFDTGTYYVLHETEGVADRSIGAGLGVADSMVPEPYFYIYAWWKNKKLDYSDAPTLTNGKWITENWEGAVLPVSKLDDDPTEALNEFFQNTSTFLKSKLQ